jgi:hypothetical protein
MYPLRNVKVASVLHPPSKMILNSCHNTYSATFMEFFCRLVQGDKHIKLASVNRLKIALKSLLLRPYWKNVYQKHGDVQVEVEALKMRVSVGSVRTGQAIIASLLTASPAVTQPEDPVELSGPSLKAVMIRGQGSRTWTSRIITMSLTVDTLTASYEEASSKCGRPTAAVVFSGVQQKGESGQPQPEHGPSTPGKAERDVPVQPWLRVLVQYPAGAEIQFVPPILSVSLGSTKAVVAPGLVVQVRALLAAHQSQDQPAAVGTGDSGFRSVEAGRDVADVEPSTLSRSLFLSELLRSAIVKVKTEGFSVYLVQKFTFGCAADCVEKTVRQLLGKDPTLLRIDLPRIEAFSSGGRIDPSLLQQHPVLFPPSVWISGKDTLPVSINLTGFQIVEGEEKQLIAPVSTK